jgi:hypothetical protein
MEKLRAHVAPLPKGNCLLIGDDWGQVQNTGGVILENFGVVVSLSLAMAIGGGLLRSRFLKCIEAITKTATKQDRWQSGGQVPRPRFHQ